MDAKAVREVVRETVAQWPDEVWCDATIDVGGACDHLTVSWDADAQGANGGETL